MILDIKINLENDMVSVIEESDTGLKKCKKINLTTFLQKYTAFLKEKDSNFEFLYFPPGTVEYFRNINSITYVVHTYSYRDFYGLTNLEDECLIIMTTNTTNTLITGLKLYSTKGAFNKNLSRFVELYNKQSLINIDGEDDGVRKGIEILDTVNRKPLSLKKKYSDIV